MLMLMSLSALNLRVSQVPNETQLLFYVSCHENSRDIFYDESIWPDGAELHDWYLR